MDLPPRLPPRLLPLPRRCRHASSRAAPRLACLALVLAVGVAVLARGAPVEAQPASPPASLPASGLAGPLAPGSVVTLKDTLHLWVADEQGALRWVGDTRALANVTPNWIDQREVTYDELKGLRRGDPLLSTGLVRLGETVYLAKWETTQPAPVLLHVQSLADLELFGIGATNYGQLVYDGPSWQQRFGINPDTLARGTLASAAPLPTPTPTPVATATPVPPAASPTPVVRMKARFEGIGRTGNPNHETKSTFIITDAPPRVRLKVSAVIREYQCSQGCSQGDPVSEVKWGPVETSPTDATGRLVYTETHLPYQFYRYTFEDPFGNKVVVDGKDDLGA
jgi:hypothetical protein